MRAPARHISGDQIRNKHTRPWSSSSSSVRTCRGRAEDGGGRGEGRLRNLTREDAMAGCRQDGSFARQAEGRPRSPTVRSPEAQAKDVLRYPGLVDRVARFPCSGPSFHH
ncbi:hypothetical protein K523DRAFT_114194 [Schizophyllum commune Tattone D]|nr:hypothetical protein K523DRAFT_114194 [Schizophyllum commune Tattone D]